MGAALPTGGQSRCIGYGAIWVLSDSRAGLRHERMSIGFREPDAVARLPRGRLLSR